MAHIFVRAVKVIPIVTEYDTGDMTAEDAARKCEQMLHAGENPDNEFTLIDMPSEEYEYSYFKSGEIFSIQDESKNVIGSGIVL